MSECPFCNFDAERVIAENDRAIALRDAHPVSRGHALVVTKRHVESWFDVTPGERADVLDLVVVVKRMLDEDLSPDGYNVGFNVGLAAGQTIDHLHVHVIPRFEGDVDDPTGGVRNVIPGKGNYRRG
jgi:diadenosine tetraphosphate (Ap4A) HIT family hydrolase